MTKDKFILALEENNVYVCNVEVSRSGMSRTFDVYVNHGDRMENVNDLFKTNKHGKVIAHGCGMDMFFHTFSTIAPNGLASRYSCL